VKSLNKQVEIINNIPDCSDCGFEEVRGGMKSDADGHGFQILPDQETVGSTEEEDSGEGEVNEENDEQTPSHNEAFSCP
jgi:hypothetical protein